MLLSHGVAVMSSVGLMVLGAGLVSGQDYPNKPIRFVTTAPGSGSDFTARLIGQEISGSLGQPVIVENRGTALFSFEVVSRAQPDGYTLLVTGGSLWILPLLRTVPYDALKDFSAITWTETTPNVLVTHSSVPVTSVKELIALAKAKPGGLNYSSSVSGGGAHLAGELFKAMAGVNIVRIPYPASGAQLNAVLGGEVQMAFANPAAVMPHVKTGKLKALAVTSAQTSALVPGLPTVAAAGLPGYESTSNNGILVPAKTPAAIITLLNQQIVRVLNKSDVKEKYFSTGVETVGSSPEQFASLIKSEIARMGKVIKDANIKID